VVHGGEFALQLVEALLEGKGILHPRDGVVAEGVGRSGALEVLDVGHHLLAKLLDEVVPFVGVGEVVLHVVVKGHGSFGILF